jgi:hypothetical protein
VDVGGVRLLAGLALGGNPAGCGMHHLVTGLAGVGSLGAIDNLYFC